MPVPIGPGPRVVDLAVRVSRHGPFRQPRPVRVAGHQEIQPLRN